MKRVWPLLILAACGGPPPGHQSLAKAVAFNATHLPLVIVDTFGESIPDEPKITASVRILLDPAGGPNMSGGVVHFEGRIGIELRGNSSQLFPKKQYGVELRDAQDDDLDVALLGMPEESDWVLQGPWADRSLLRNWLVYETSRALGHYAPRVHFVELLLVEDDRGGPPEDYYWGVYLLMEKIKRDKNRVDIKKLKSEHDAEPEISGGYILEIVSASQTNDDDVVFESRNGTLFEVKEPKASKITPEQLAWIEDHIDRFEGALDDGTWRQWADEGSFVDFVILNELFRNGDVFYASTYVHKDREGPLVMGPVWDYNEAMDNGLIAPIAGWEFKERRAWARPLARDDLFADTIIARWQALRAGPLSNATLLARIDEGVARIGEAADRDMFRWGGNHAAEVAELKDYLTRRADWMDQNIQTLRP